MTRLILLDSGPLGLVTNPRPSERSQLCKAWLRELLAADTLVIVPEIADYEVRRELLRAGRTKGITRLDELAEQIGYLEVNTRVLRRAAELWAQARNAGVPTADDKALDGDMILAAQALIASEDGFDATVATTNVGHLGRFVRAAPWESIAVIPPDQGTRYTLRFAGGHLDGTTLRTDSPDQNEVAKASSFLLMTGQGEVGRGIKGMSDATWAYINANIQDSPEEPRIPAELPLRLQIYRIVSNRVEEGRTIIDFQFEGVDPDS